MDRAAVMADPDISINPVHRGDALGADLSRNGHFQSKPGWKISQFHDVE
jgi:hypothetical protein